jgi:hypothetical protein
MFLVFLFFVLYNVTLILIVPVHKTHSCLNICIITGNAFPCIPAISCCNTAHCCMTREEEGFEYLVPDTVAVRSTVPLYWDTQATGSVSYILSRVCGDYIRGVLD